MDHQTRYDDRGWVKVVDPDGKVRTLGGEYWGEQGLSWSRDGRKVLFSATDFEGVGYQPHMASVAGVPAAHVVLPSIGSVLLLDAAEDRWILVRDDVQLGIRGVLAGTTEEKELGWLDMSLMPLLSNDGRTLVFSDESQSAGGNYAVMMRRVDATGAVRLGEGVPFGLSPDGSRVLAGVPTPMQVRLYPTGAGEPITLNTGPLATLQRAAFFPDGKRVLICGGEQTGALRCYAVDVAGGQPKAVLPEGMSPRTIAPDGRHALATTPDGTVVLVDFASQRTQPVAITDATDIAGWSSDGQSLYVYGRTLPSRLERVDLASGQRTLLRELGPPDRAGLMLLTGAALTPDATAYAYGYWRRFSKLFVVKHPPAE
jgi:hypothetical protein